jgi:hypothetical protein
MVRAAIERCAVAAFAFMAAATWLGVGLVHGLLCLSVALLASFAVRLYQRRSDSHARAASRRRHRPRPRPANGQPARARHYDADREDFDWPSIGDAAW